MDSPFNNRQMFDRYLYDYFIKKGMRETAEIFRRETGIRIDPESPPEIDVPEGFLQEWWSINSDHFSGWERQTSQDNAGPYIEEGNMWQENVPTQLEGHELNEQSVPTQLGEHELNEQMIEELTIDESFGVILGNNLLSETVPNHESSVSTSAPANQDCTVNQELDAIVQAYLRTTVAPNEAGPSVPNPKSSISSSAPANQDCTDNRGLESVVEGFLRSTRIAPSESGWKRKRSRDLEDGSTDMPCTNNSRLQTSSSFRNLENLFELPSCCAKVEEDKHGASFNQDNNKFSQPTYLVEEKKDVERIFSRKGITCKLSSSLMEEKEEDIGDSNIKGNKNEEEEDSSSRDASMHDSSSHDKENEDDVISAINLDEHYEAPKDDESQGVIIGGNLVPETVPHLESLTWSPPPANLGTDTLGLDSVSSRHS